MKFSVCFFLKFFIYSTDNYLQVHSCSACKRHVALSGPRFFFFCLFLLTNIYTYRFIYYHKWRMSPPPQQSHFTTEGSSSGPKWCDTSFRPKYLFFFFSFLFFLLPYIGFCTSANSRCCHHHHNYRGFRGVTKGMPCGMFFFFWFSFIFILLTFFLDTMLTFSNNHHHEQPLQPNNEWPTQPKDEGWDGDEQRDEEWQRALL